MDDPLIGRADAYKIIADQFTGFALVLVDTQGLIAEWPGSAQKLLGWKPEEVKGKPCAILLSPEQGNPVDIENELQAAARNRPIFSELWHIKKNGEKFLAEIRVECVRNEAGGLIGFSKVIRDVTMENLAGNLLKASEEKYRTLFSAMDQGFCLVEVILDPDGEVFDYRFLEVNPAFERHTGIHGATGRTMRELAGGELIGWFHTYGEVALSGQHVHFETQVAALGDRWFDVYAFRPAMSDRMRVAILFSDISDRKRMEEQLANEARRKDEFLATLAHELRNPLAPLSNSLSILMRGKLDAESTVYLRQVMKRQVDHLARLVDDLLDVSRVSTGKVSLNKEKLELQPILDRAVEISRPSIEQKRQELIVDSGSEPITLDADPVRLTQVVANILNNASKYTPEGGCITLSAKQTGTAAIIAVEDTGIGIAADMLPKVFDLFTQADSAHSATSGGLGIGLALTKKLVELHAGSVSAESEGLGKGSRFEVRLPADAAAEATPPAETEVDQKLGSHRVVVVDDNEDSSLSLAIFLRLSGQDVKMAHTGPAAIEVVRQFRPRLALVDISLPGCDGYEVARVLRREFSSGELRLVATTGFGQKEDRRRSQEAGFDAHLVKPVSFEAIEEILSELDGHEPEYVSAGNY